MKNIGSDTNIVRNVLVEVSSRLADMITQLDFTPCETSLRGFLDETLSHLRMFLKAVNYPSSDSASTTDPLGKRMAARGRERRSSPSATSRRSQGCAERGVGHSDVGFRPKHGYITVCELCPSNVEFRYPDLLTAINRGVLGVCSQQQMVAASIASARPAPMVKLRIIRFAFDWTRSGQSWRMEVQINWARQTLVPECGASSRSDTGVDKTVLDHHPSACVWEWGRACLWAWGRDA